MYVFLNIKQKDMEKEIQNGFHHLDVIYIYQCIGVLTNKNISSKKE